MEDPRITRIEWGRLEGARPRAAGVNARIGVHGKTVRPAVARLTAEDGSSGFGVARATRDQAQAVIGQRLSSAFSGPGTRGAPEGPSGGPRGPGGWGDQGTAGNGGTIGGASEPWIPLEYPLFDLVARAGRAARLRPPGEDGGAGRGAPRGRGGNGALPRPLLRHLPLHRRPAPGGGRRGGGADRRGGAGGVRAGAPGVQDQGRPGGPADAPGGGDAAGHRRGARRARGGGAGAPDHAGRQQRLQLQPGPARPGGDGGLPRLLAGGGLPRGRRPVPGAEGVAGPGGARHPDRGRRGAGLPRPPGLGPGGGGGRGAVRLPLVRLHALAGHRKAPG